jgi:hypothetical protein
MVILKRPPEEAGIKYEELIAQFFLVLGLVLFFLGFIGILISITLYSKTYEKNQALLAGLYFLHFYITILGATLAFYHKRIVIKARRT